MAKYEKSEILSQEFYTKFDEIKRIAERVYKPTDQFDLEVWLVSKWREINYDIDFLTDLAINYLKDKAGRIRSGSDIHNALKVKADHTCYDRLQELWARFVEHHTDAQTTKEGYYLLYDNGIPAIYTVRCWQKETEALQAAQKLGLQSGFYCIQHYPESIKAEGPDSTNILVEEEEEDK